MMVGQVSPTRFTTDPWLETHEPPEPLWRAAEYAADNPNAPRINATLLALVRNEEVDDMVTSMKDLERTWNRKFNYPWTFFNDVPFTDEFKEAVRRETKAQVNFGMYRPARPRMPKHATHRLLRYRAHT